MTDPPIFNPVRYRWAAGLFVVAACLLPVGCQRDSITLYKSVPATRQIDEADAQGEPRFRMVTAIADQPQATWFFKLTGPIDNMQAVMDRWGQFLDSVKFDNPEPEWELPTAWASDGFQDRPMPGGMKMRIAEIATEQEQVTVSVSNMPPGQQLLPNVNRWRGQLGLSPTNPVALATQLTEFKNASVTVKVFAASGPTLSTRMGGAPFANAARGKRPAMPGGQVPAGQSSPHSGMSGAMEGAPSQAPVVPFEYKAPEDWQSGKTSSMVAGNWSKQIDDETVAIKLLTMNPTDESWKLNVEAWALQVGTDKPVIDEVTEKAEVDGTEARMVRLFGPDIDKPEQNKAVTAAMFQAADASGYVLMLSGTQQHVEQNAKVFQSLLDSIRFDEANDEANDEADKEKNKDADKDADKEAGK